MNAADFIKEHPTCCFCGGTTAATTIEHQPAKIIFPNKHRPKGLEFPSCQPCNAQTSGDEALVALVARAGGSIRSPEAGLDDRIDDVIQSVNSRWPSLLHELLKTQRLHDQEHQTSVIDVRHPQIAESLCRVAAKSALATYYCVTGEIADRTATIDTKWTMRQGGEKAAVSELVELLPKSISLIQGRWDTTDTFFLRYHREEDLLYQVVMLHECVVLIAKLAASGAPESWKPLMKRWAPVAGIGIAELSTDDASITR